MEAAPSAKPPPVPPNYVSLRDLQELRLKEKEEQERRRREEEEAAAAAAAAAARREAEKAAMKAEAKRRAASWEASGGVRERERHRAGKAQGQGNQWVAVAHRAPASTPRPVAAGKREAAIGSGRGEKGPDDAPHGGGNPRVKAKWKGKGKGKLAEAAPAPSHGGKPAEVVPASPCGGGKPENKSESNSKAKGKDPGNQAAESSLSSGPAEAAILSSRDRSRRGRPAGAGGRSGAETCPGIAPVKTAGPPPLPRGVRSDDTGKPKPPAPRRADAVVAGGDSPDGKKAGPAQVPPASAADGGSKPTSGGELRKTTEAKPGGQVEGQRQRRRQVEAAQAVAAELNPRVARCSVGPLRGRGNEPVLLWVPKAAAGSSAGAGL
ncbi:unnamed protein product [Urochloa decumbens]|uniref:Uncharacterized protein n=1 Tax=Urochloa decumbens TaxID=240449 RepID=A0ABC8Y2Q3_9POAL